MRIVISHNFRTALMPSHHMKRKHITLSVSYEKQKQNPAMSEILHLPMVLEEHWHVLSIFFPNLMVKFDRACLIAKSIQDYIYKCLYFLVKCISRHKPPTPRHKHHHYNTTHTQKKENLPASHV